MATKPTAAQLEPTTGLAPNARTWIKTLVEERLIRGISALQATIPAPTPSSCNCQGRVDDLLKRIEYLEQRQETDERYALTKAKVIALLEKHGIE